MKVQRHLFNQFERKEDKPKRLVSQKEVWAHSKEQAVKFVKDIHGREHWYDYLGVEANDD